MGWGEGCIVNICVDVSNIRIDVSIFEGKKKNNSCFPLRPQFLHLLLLSPRILIRSECRRRTINWLLTCHQYCSSSHAVHTPPAPITLLGSCS